MELNSGGLPDVVIIRRGLLFKVRSNYKGVVVDSRKVYVG